MTSSNRWTWRFAAGWILIAGLCISPAFADETTVRFKVLLVGNEAGTQVSTRSQAEVRVQFEFNDRGRGPKLDSTIELGEGGVPVAVRTSGNDYLKASVEETFTLESGVAKWKNKAEEGTEEVDGPAFYSSMDGSIEELGLLAAALMKAEGKSLPLLPVGQASIESLGELEISSGDESRTVHHYEISGLGFVPSDVWLDDDSGFFAYVDDWFTVIPEGWESSVEAMLDRQTARAEAREKGWIERLADRPKGGFAITGARLFDADSATMRDDMTVLVAGNRIEAVGLDGTIAIPAGARVVDAAGKSLLPGLWDMHAHLSPTDGPLNIAAGVTSARDMANDIDSLLALERRWDAGEAIGPRVLRAGFMDGPGPFAGPTKVLVDTADEAIEWVDKYAEMGYEQIKIYSSVKPELVAPVAQRAHEKGLRVSGHIPAGMWAEDAVRQGYDEITHINMFFLNFYKDVTDTRTPARFIEVASRGADLDFESPEVRAFIEMLVVGDIVVDPTVTVFESMFKDRPGQLSSSYAMIADRLPPQVRRGLLAGGLPVPEGMEEQYPASFRRMLDAIAHLYRQGVPLVAGTDGLTGFTLHRELELYVEAGIPSGDVLRIATLGAARLTGRDEKLGSIVPGKLADMVLVEGDPVADISDIRNVVTTIKDGAIYDTASVYSLLGIR